MSGTAAKNIAVNGWPPIQAKRPFPFFLSCSVSSISFSMCFRAKTSSISLPSSVGSLLAIILTGFKSLCGTRISYTSKAMGRKRVFSGGSQGARIQVVVFLNLSGAGSFRWMTDRTCAGTPAARDRLRLWSPAKDLGDARAQVIAAQRIGSAWRPASASRKFL